MKIGLFTAFVFGLGLGVAVAQDTAAPVSPAPSSGLSTGQSHGGGGRGGWGGGMGMGGGRGVLGTVAEAAADHYTVKTDTGEVFTVQFGVNTRIVKQIAGQGRGQGMGQGSAPPQTIKPGEIKVGDVISAMGEMDATSKSLGAMVVVLMDPERAKQMREMQANFGKTWLMGKVTAIHEFTVVLQSNVDNASHSFTADENTTFRKRRDPITLADIQVGDSVRVEGSVKNGAFLAGSVAVMGMPPAGNSAVPHAGGGGSDAK